MSHVPPDDRPSRATRRDALLMSSGVELGHEPALSSNGAVAPEVDRREINLRWLGASILTGVTGAVLIGASIHVAIEGATTSVQPPQLAALNASPRSGEGEERASNAVRKGDRLNMTELTASAKQTFRAPMTIR